MKRSESSELEPISSVADRLTSRDGIDRSAIRDWLRIHRMLVDLEAEFSEVAMRAAAGEISVDELQDKRGHLMAMRDLCSSVYERAFGGARRP